MSGGSLSQAEIDALLNSMINNAPAESVPQHKNTGTPLPLDNKETGPVPPAAASPPPAPVVAAAKSPKWQGENVQRVSANANESDGSGGDSNIISRLENLEKWVRRIETLEQRVAQLSNSDGGNPDQSMAKQIQTIGAEVKQISSRLKGTLGYGAYQDFKCDQCGTEHTVATVLKCTSCGHQNWRGWWPRKK